MMAMNVDSVVRSPDQNGAILRPMLENGRGADMLRAGKHEPALRHFVLALEAIQGWLSSQNYHEEENSVDGDGDVNVTVIPKYSVTTLLGSPCQADNDEEMVSFRRVRSGSSSLEDNRSFLIWIEPFTFIGSNTFCKADMARDSLPTGASCCTLFNMALVFHMRGDEGDALDAACNLNGVTDPERSRRPILFRKAIQLYKQCLELLEQLPPFQDGISSASWLVFEIAVWNNLSHCYQQLSLDDASGKCLEKLLKILMMVLHGKVLVRNCDTLLDVELDLLASSEVLLENVIGCNDTFMTALPA